MKSPCIFRQSFSILYPIQIHQNRIASYWLICLVEIQLFDQARNKILIIFILAVIERDSKFYQHVPVGSPSQGGPGTSPFGVETGRIEEFPLDKIDLILFNHEGLPIDFLIIASNFPGYWYP